MILNTGVNETVSKLYYDGVRQLCGTYGSTSSAAEHQDNDWFSGDGILTVGVPKTLVIGGKPIVIGGKVIYGHCY